MAYLNRFGRGGAGAVGTFNVVSVCMALMLVLACLPSTWAHEELEEQIENASAAIAKDPTNPRLYLTRAELHRLHAEFDEALADLEVAAGLDATLPELEFVRGKIYVDLKHPKAAQAAFDRFITLAPTMVEGYLARGRLFTDQQEIAKAVADYTQAIAQAKSPLPEYYIERARLEQLPGGAGAAAALKSLDEGIVHCGALVTLELPAKDIDIAAGRIDAALARIDLLMNASPRQETYREIRGAILEQAGRKDEALAEYRQALACCAAAPATTQATPMLEALKARVEQRIARLTGAAEPAPVEVGPRKLPAVPAVPAVPKQ